MEGYVFGLVDDTHAAATKLLDDAIVRDGLADHSEIRGYQVLGRFILRTWHPPVNAMNTLYAGRHGGGGEIISGLSAGRPILKRSEIMNIYP